MGAGLFRIVLMPVDAAKTIMQVGLWWWEAPLHACVRACMPLRIPAHIHGRQAGRRCCCMMHACKL